MQKKILSLFCLLSMPLIIVSASCDTASNCATSCTTSVNSCNQSGCFDSCATSVCNTSCENSVYCPTLLLKRPTYDNTVINYGQKYAHVYDKDDVYGGFQLAFEYQRSLDAKNLARGMFGSNVLNFAGSQVVNPTANALLADNFGLPQNFQGFIKLDPIIQDFNIHFDGFIGFDRWVKGLYLQVDMNFDYQVRQIQSESACTINNTSTALFPAGYMSVATNQVTAVGDIQTALELESIFGDKKQASTFGRFDFSSRSRAGLAGLSANFGYDFVNRDNYFLGAFFRVVAPTGTSVNPCFVFDPVVGNGKGWEVGGGLSSRWVMWNNNDCQKLTAMLDGYVVTVLKHNSLRTFDLASTNTALLPNYHCATSCNTSCNSWDNAFENGCNSCNVSTNCSTGCNTSTTSCNTCNAANCLTRYSLLKQFNVNGSSYTYANNLITAADFTTRSVDVRTPVKGDATLRIVYTHGGFDFGFGYNVFGMSREKISSVGAPSSCLFTSTSTVFGVKGCQGVGYNTYATSLVGSATVITTGVIASTLPLVNTVSNASAYNNGCGNGCGTVDNRSLVTPGAGTFPALGTFNAAFNSNSNNAAIVANAPVTTLLATGYVQPTASVPPVVLVGDVNELDLCSGTAPRQFTNKGFISLDYTWEDRCWSPYIGFIAEIEGGTRNTDVAQWGVVLRGGASY